MTSIKLVVKAPLRNLVLLQILPWKRRLTKKGMELIPVKKGQAAVKFFENLMRSGVAAENLEMVGKEAMELMELV